MIVNCNKIGHCFNIYLMTAVKVDNECNSYLQVQFA